ncbi:unnamed protein product [Ostreobium quekettii]|uniref:Small ubiquitin-related modifier n=1 Tax=Ostreobium quekettii TaxID=121088 RepID=A0A8S1IQQ1_9CHLO|nr:unnamed protein product [Ostreobium quekettii]|eukprot:evm.model.scf_51.11 EVM.evm.TU.scf_51.11   scf_51:82015-84882(-)
MSEDAPADPVQGAEATNETQPKVEKGEPINVVVKDQHGIELHFKVRKTTKFDKIMKAYCDKKSFQLNQLRFLYDGERLKPDQSPEEVEMEDGDVIDCVMQQIGGH